MPRRIGILGGTFDPVHVGHLVLAACAREQLNSDEFVLIPNAASPLKSAAPVAPFADRLEMLNLALGDVASMSVSDLEGRRGGVSYMVDTLATILDQTPDAELHLVLGSDSLRDLPRWKDAATIQRLARLAVVMREGDSHDFVDGGVTLIRMPRIDISASRIRERIARGLSIDFFTPPPVVSHIHRTGLYRTR
jgi:nicotinate-nucleotide adenylyltransferase